MSAVNITFNRKTTSPQERELILTRVRQEARMVNRYSLDTRDGRIINSFLNVNNHSSDDIAKMLIGIFEHAGLQRLTVSSRSQDEAQADPIGRNEEIHLDVR